MTSAAYDHYMTTVQRLIAILILFFTGCEQPSTTPLQKSPEAAVVASIVNPTEEPSSEPASATGPIDATNEITGRVVGIIDGDTIDILSDDKTTIRIRLNGIDAPEKGQPFGATAKEFLSESIGGLDVRVVTHGKDRYGRVIGDVYSSDDADSLPHLSTVNATMVVNGLAWHYVKYAPDRNDLADAEKWAREKRLRLWSDRRSIAPWDWRKLSKEERDKLR